MKKRMYAVLAILTMVALVLGTVSCGGGGSDSPSKVTVSFNLDGGTYNSAASIANVSVEKGKTLGTKLPTTGLARSNGEVFDYWLNKLKAEKVDASTKINENMTLTAQWKSQSLTGINVFYDSNGGSNVASQKLTTAGKITKPADPTKEGFDFDGWYKDEAFKLKWNFDTDTLDRNITLYAKWKEQEGKSYFAVTFESNGGSHVAGFEVVEGGKIHKPADPVKANNNFDGWYKEAALTSAWNFDTDTVTKATTLYAKWTPIDPNSTWKITFSLNGAPGTKPVDINVTKGAAAGNLFPADPTWADHTFKGWFESAQAAAGDTRYTKDTLITKNLNLFASWEGGGQQAVNEIVEEVGIGNGWYVIFQFKLPAGNTWEDYKGLSADYKIDDVSQTVRARIFGNYVQSEIEQVRLGQYVPATGDPVNIAVVGSWPGGTSNRWIMDNAYGSGKAVSEQFAAFEPEDNVWFTVTYPNKPGSSPLADWNGGVYPGGNNSAPENALEGRVPKTTDTGPFYLGVGMTSAAGVTSSIVSQIKNVTLIGYDDTIPNVIGMPLYFKAEGKLHRAYAGQFDGGSTQSAEPSWKIIEGAEYIVPIDYSALEDIEITLDAHNGTEPVVVVMQPGERLSADDLADPADPADGDWKFEGWFTAASGGTKVTTATVFNESTTIHAQWTEIVGGIIITYNLTSAYTGSETIAPRVIEEGGSLSAAQITLPAGISVDGKVFGGWYTVDTTAGTFNYDDYTKLVTPTTKFNTATTIYAFWYAPYDSSAIGNIEGFGGARVDKDGYVIMAADTINAWLGTGAYDSLLSRKFSAAEVKGQSIKITYAVKDIIVPTLTEAETTAGMEITTGAILKKAYNSWDSTTSGTYFNWNRAGGTLERDMNLFQLTGDTAGFSIQINKGDDTSNKNKRAGYVYGIKFTSFEVIMPPTGTVVKINYDTLTDPLAGITNKDLVLSSGNLNIVAPTGFASYEWRLNGANKGGTNTLTLPAAEYVELIGKKYTVSVVVTDDEGNKFSQTIIVTVKK
jgi:uncharacterized repeat protein (TIGR02543 family)